MTKESFLITGGTGCIGSWVVKNLISEGKATSILDHGGSRHRLKLIMPEEDIKRINFVPGDLTNLSSIEHALSASRASNIIHLAALQLPFCKADPAQGARVNVVGTVNVFEAAKRADVQKLVYASSIAVYSLDDDYPENVVAHDAALKPRSLYGVFKQANEGIGRVYWIEDQLASIGLRPFVVYGPGRDQGMTSTPTKAMLAAVAGRSYTISFGGQYGFQFVDDVAKIFIKACQVPYKGADTFNIGGSPSSTSDIIAAIERFEPQHADGIDFNPRPLPFPFEFENTELHTILGELPNTPLDGGVEATIEVFKNAISEGHFSDEYLEAQMSS